MNVWLKLEDRISYLENEVKFAIFPVTRESFVEDAAKIKGRFGLDQWDYGSKMYLEFLEGVKSEKDRDSYAWRKMKQLD